MSTDFTPQGSQPAPTSETTEQTSGVSVRMHGGALIHNSATGDLRSGTLSYDASQDVAPGILNTGRNDIGRVSAGNLQPTDRVVVD